MLFQTTYVVAVVLNVPSVTDIQCHKGPSMDGSSSVVYVCVGDVHVVRSSYLMLTDPNLSPVHEVLLHMSTVYLTLKLTQVTQLSHKLAHFFASSVSVSGTTIQTVTQAKDGYHLDSSCFITPILMPIIDYQALVNLPPKNHLHQIIPLLSH